MLIYDFLEQRFDQLNDDSYLHGKNMVDKLLDSNIKEFNQYDVQVDTICLELWQEFCDDLTNEDIPF